MEQNEKNKTKTVLIEKRVGNPREKSRAQLAQVETVSQSFLKSIMWFGRTGDCWLQRVNITYT